jgi:hypothetical protein
VHVGQGVVAIKAGHEPKRSAVAEGSISKGHCSDFGGISISHRISRHVGDLVKEATEINLDKNNFKRRWLHIEPGLVTCNLQVMNVTTGPIRAVPA